MATLTIKIPASNPMDIAEIQKRLSVYAECLVKSLKNKKIQTTPSESLSSIYGIGKLDGETLENLKEEAFSERFKI